ncbi:MAG TPA: ABC transporter substrate-binding protein [Stellaceae bacterium]|nr:ABC transporter substrate-binding protein [Stellaceae bacterium]
MRLLRTLLAAALLATAVGTVAGADTIKIGAINPYSGALALYGEECARGYQLAIDEANAKGGVLGKQIELVKGDASNPQQAIAAVQRLATSEGVDIFTGTYISAVSNAASDAAAQYQKLYWDTNALAAELTQRGLPNFVRSGPYALNFAEVSANAVTGLIAPALGKQPGQITVWIDHEDSIYGTSIAQKQKELLEKAGVKVAAVDAHSVKAIDLTDSVLRAKQANPDVWINTGYVPDNNLLLRTMRDQGFNPAAIILVGTGDTFETRDALGADMLNGILVVGYPEPDQSEAYGPGAHAYLAAYKKKYEKDPIAPQSMTAYVGLKILLEAVASAGSTDMAKVRAAAAKMDKPVSSYATGYGVKFDETFQNTRAAPTVKQWQGGKVVTVFPTAAAAEGTKLVNLPRK